MAGILVGFHSLIEVVITGSAFHQHGIGPSLESRGHTLYSALVGAVGDSGKRVPEKCAEARVTYLLEDSQNPTGTGIRGSRGFSGVGGSRGISGVGGSRGISGVGGSRGISGVGGSRGISGVGGSRGFSGVGGSRVVGARSRIIMASFIGNRIMG